MFDRVRARHVALGCGQRPGLDFLETFSPVAQLASVRVVMAIIAGRNYVTIQIDITQAYMHADLEEEIYIELPRNIRQYHKDGRDIVWRLKKALYGLRQAGACWHADIDKALRAFGFRASLHDPCIYMLNNDRYCMMLGLYVDDLICGSSSDEGLDELHSYLLRRFQRITRSELTCVLGIEISKQHDGSYLLHQTSYLAKLVADYPEVKEFDTPMDVNFKISSHDSPKTPAELLANAGLQRKYATLVGQLMWPSRACRPELATAVNILARFTHAPAQRHYNALLRVVGFVKRHPEMGLVYPSGANTKDITRDLAAVSKPQYKHQGNICNRLLAFVDSDHARSEDDRKSVSGCLIFLGGCAVDWFSTKQQLVTVSSTEAEYVAMSQMSRHVIFVKGVVADLGLPQGAVPMFGDNLGSIFLTGHTKVDTSTKAVDVRFHHIRELVATKQIQVIWIPTTFNLADLLTKPLPPLILFGFLVSFMKLPATKMKLLSVN